MAFTTQTNGSNTQLTFAYTVPTSRASVILPKLARGLFDEGFTAGITLSPDQTAPEHNGGQAGQDLSGGLTSADLTNAQMRTIIDAFVKSTLNSKINELHLLLARETAESTAQQELASINI